MTPFDLAEPRSLREALDLLADADPAVRAASGCTALMLMMKAGVLKPTLLVSLRALAPSLSAIEVVNGEIAIGALTTLSAMAHSPHVRDLTPVLTRTLRTLSNVRVRNVATLGGHLAHADPHMDLPPVLIALGASALIMSRAGKRTIPIEELITGYLETSLHGGELITEIRIPIAQCAAAYMKVTSRSADDWPSLGVAVAVQRVNAEITGARVVVSAAVDRPTRLQEVESLLTRAAIDERLLQRAGEAAAAEAKPVADQHGSAAYKRQLIKVYVSRALRQALGLAPQGAYA